MPGLQKNNLIHRVERKNAMAGIIGPGYVSDDRIRTYSSETREPGNSGTFQATCDFSQASKAGSLILCVPAPLNKYREPDLHFITDTVDALLPYLRPGQMLCSESTTYPGTTDEVLIAACLSARDGKRTAFPPDY